MNYAWLYTIPGFIVLCLGAYCSYSKSFRDSSYYFPAFAGLSLILSWIWVSASRKFDTVSAIMLFSLVWDALMVVAYYAGPMILKGDKFGWQTYAAALVTVGGIIWFKISVG